MAKKHDNGSLEKLYSAADQADQEVFAEQRSNVLLYSGTHYSNRSSKWLSRIRDNKDLSSEQRLRITKNHIQKICKLYENNILNYAPSVTVVPANEKELSDIKSAELHQAVWEHTKAKHRIKAKQRDFVKDFVEIGEVAVKIFWDPNIGELKGFEADVDPLTGQPKVDQAGQMIASNRPVFTGDWVFERIFGFNLLRDPGSISMADSPYLIVRKMMKVEDLKAMVEGEADELTRKEKLEWIQKTQDETFVVFDGNQAGYKKSENETLVQEFYFKPCHLYPRGYFYIKVKAGILFEDELPGGVFPIVYTGFDEYATAPRGRSIIRTLRPYQIEINRAASKIAEHQITLGDDKLLIQQGTKIASGGQVPGVRSIQYTGMPPTILAGRDGSQYLNYLNSQIAEMYQVSGVTEDAEEKQPSQLDPYTLLFQQMRQKKKFSLYAEKIEEFQINLVNTFFELAKVHLPDEVLIPAIGRSEHINIAEFKSAEPLCYRVKLEAQGEDIESKLGKQLVMNQVLQYASGQLDKEDIGKLVKNMPLGNVQEVFSDLTLDYESANNVILALDRGETPVLGNYDNHNYMVKRLVARMRSSDFQTLKPQIQQAYANRVLTHERLILQQQQQAAAATSGFVPSGGYAVTCDLYVKDPANPVKTKRLRVSSEALQWLIQKLEQQGSSLEQLQLQELGVQAEIGALAQGQANSQAGATEGAQSAQGQDSPGGMNANGIANGSLGHGELTQPVIGANAPGQSSGVLT